MIPSPAFLRRTNLKSKSPGIILFLDIVFSILLFGGFFTFFKDLILTHFYVNGGYILDSGWLASLTWRNGIAPLNPLLAVPPDHQCFLQNHMFLLTPILSLLSYLSPFPMAVWFAGVYGVMHALAALGAYFIFRHLLGIGIWAQAGAFGSAVLLLFSSPVIENYKYPHIECFLFPTATLLILGLLWNRSWMVWSGVILSAAVREDGGFHIAAPFLLVLFFTLLFPRFFGPIDHRKRLQYFLISLVAILLSLAALFLPGFFVQTSPLFKEEYLGSPLYGHVSMAFISHQAIFFFNEKACVWCPLLMLLVIGLIRHDVMMVSASLAYVPWLTLNLFAIQDGAQKLESYHIFPLYMTFLFACLPPPKEIGKKGVEQPAVQSHSVQASLVISAVLLSIFLQPQINWTRVTNDFLNAPTSTQIATTERFYTLLPRLRQELGTLIANAPIGALAPHDFTPWEGRPEFHIPDLESKTDSLIFFGRSWDQEALWLAFDPRFQTYQITGTPFFVATRHRIEDMPLLAGLSTPASPISPLMQSRGDVTLGLVGAVLAARRDGMDTELFGPGVRLPSGHYQLSLALQFASGSDNQGCQLDVYAAGTTYASTACVPGSNSELSVHPVLPFDVSATDNEKRFEFRIIQKGQRTIHLTSLTIQRSPDPVSATP